MSDGGAGPSVYTIPAHRSFADALVNGLIRRFGRDPMALAAGRILCPNNRAVRTLTDAFVRASGTGLVLPRLIAIGDPELDDRIGGAFDVADLGDPIPPAIDPLSRQLLLAELLRRPGEGAAESLRLAAELARVLDALTIEGVDARRLAEIGTEVGELAGHWQASFERLQVLVNQYPSKLRERGLIDLADRRDRLLRATAERWRRAPPEGFTIAAGISTSAPAVAALLARTARLPEGSVVLAGLALNDVMPDEEWEALGPNVGQRPEPTHPQYHLKRLLNVMGVARAEVRRWSGGGRAASPAVRGRAVAHAMTAADFSDKWSRLPPRERRLSGIRAVELADPGSEAMAIAIALREAVETPGQTAALITPDRSLALRVSALLARWGIEADDSAGRPLSQTPAGRLLLGIASVAAEAFAPVPLLALFKHPLVGGEGDDRLRWLEAVRKLDLNLRGPRPAAGLDGLDQHFEGQSDSGWDRLRPSLTTIADRVVRASTLGELAGALRQAATDLAGERAWSGADGRQAATLIAEIEGSDDAAKIELEARDWLPTLRGLLDAQAVRPAYGGHPRIFIWGLLEARLQHADLVILGGLNEGIWPASPTPDPWLAPKIRSLLDLPGLDDRTGLAAHDFASALGAPRVLLSRARRDARSPTVASRFWLRLEAMTGGLPRDPRLERLVAAIDRPQGLNPSARPAPRPPQNARPGRIAVTDLDRLKADPFAFYAKTILRLRPLDPVDVDHTAAWRGTAVHDVFDAWYREDGCDPARLTDRARALLGADSIHPMLRALWQPRLLAGIDWVADEMMAVFAANRQPIASEIKGEAEVAGVVLHGAADRIDRLGDGSLAVVDYKTGKAPAPGAIAEGFALQLGLLALIARAGGFPGIDGKTSVHEYWSLARDKDGFGKRSAADQEGADDFVERTRQVFAEAVERWLTGDDAFQAKLNPAFAPYGDYDQLMRLEEWYGRT